MKWEYKAINFGSMLKTGHGAAKKVEQICNEYGAQGWELVNFQSYDMASKFMLVFKRPVSE